MGTNIFNLRDARCGLLITGLPVVETTISDTIKVAKNKYIILFCIFLGASVGFASSFNLYNNDLLCYFLIFYFAFAPIGINFLSNYVALTYIKSYKIIKSYSTPTVRTIISVLIAKSIVWMAFIGLIIKLEVSTEVNPFIVLAIPVLYVSISETIHYVIYRYIIYDIDQDEPLTPGSLGGFATQPKVYERALANPMPTGVQADLPPTDAPADEITIGSQTVCASDIIMLEAHGNLLRIVTSSGEHLERCQMYTAADALDENLGLQVHRSKWVSFTSISGLVRIDRQLCVELTNGDAVRIARPRERSVRLALKEKGLVKRR